MLKFGAYCGYWLKNGEVRDAYVTFKVPFADRYNADLHYRLAIQKVNKKWPKPYNQPFVTETHPIDNWTD